MLENILGRSPLIRWPCFSFIYLHSNLAMFRIPVKNLPMTSFLFIPYFFLAPLRFKSFTMNGWPTCFVKSPGRRWMITADLFCQLFRSFCRCCNTPVFSLFVGKLGVALAQLGQYLFENVSRRKVKMTPLSPNGGIA